MDTNPGDKAINGKPYQLAGHRDISAVFRMKCAFENMMALVAVSYMLYVAKKMHCCVNLQNDIVSISRIN